MIHARQEPTLDGDATVQAPARRRPRSAAPIVASLIALALVVAGWFWLSQPEPALELAPRPAATAPAVRPAVPPAADGALPSERAPLQLPPEEERLTAQEVAGALARFVGRDAVLRFLETTDFPRRAVATLDSLGRDHAPVAAWPVRPTPGQFLPEGAGPVVVTAAANAKRYEPFVAFVGSLDAAGTVELYRRMYPVLQQAYRELGFGDRSLNDRVLEVIDLLLATPEPAQAPALTLTEVKGPIPSVRPWTRYEYADANLERLTAGQKILLRVGPENGGVLKAKLREIRGRLVKGS